MTPPRLGRKEETLNTSQNASGVPHGAPLQVSTAPRHSDIRLSVHVAPGASLGQCEVQLGLGRGSKGTRPGDDHALHVAAVRRLAEDLKAYAHDYELAALAEDPADWWERLAVAADAVRPGRTTLCPCGEPTRGQTTKNASSSHLNINGPVVL